MECVDRAAVSYAREVADSDWVHISSESSPVPDSSILTQKHITYKSGIWSNPSVFDLWNHIVNGHNLSVPTKVSSPGNVVDHSRTESIHRYKTSVLIKLLTKSSLSENSSGVVLRLQDHLLHDGT